ncbi:hypothetical protein BVC80_243g1 [Macleaya cordata]|uniref:Uncharacterized protein n=1 Tax=Macleaya cordata TaxID=56857 RepID=A0A200R155_MACCD|nr:hypothetical protein BVC80_243g1 [Macleaya cordata]
MRVLFCKFPCPSFICFCKPSPHLLTPCPLKLENGPNVPAAVCSVPDSVGQLSDEKIEDDKESLDGKQEIENLPKSSLKKPSLESGAGKEVEKGRVQWMDLLGKELVEIKEFEPRIQEYKATPSSRKIRALRKSMGGLMESYRRQNAATSTRSAEYNFLTMASQLRALLPQLPAVGKWEQIPYYYIRFPCLEEHLVSPSPNRPTMLHGID